ncbi:MAG: ATP synthase F0 subunit B [Polyangiaceae bacterium]
MKRVIATLGAFASLALGAGILAEPALAQEAPQAPATGAPGVGHPNQPPFRRPHRLPHGLPTGARVPHGVGGHRVGPAIDAPQPEGSAHGAGGGEHAEHGEHAGGHHELGPINWADFSNKKQVPYVALLINLAILGFIFVRFGKKPIAEGLKKRKTDIAKDIEEATRLKKDAQERAKKYQASLENLDKDLETTKKGLEDAGRAEKERLIAEAEERAARMKRDADFLLEQESKQTKVDLTKQTVLEASRLAADLLKKNITPSDHDRLCEEFLEDLGRKTAAHATGAAS